MELVISKKTFIAQARKQHKALLARSVVIQLSDIQESLALAYGFENLATLYATFAEEESSVVDATAFRAQVDNLFVVSWFADMNDDEIMGIYPPGTSIDDVLSCDWKAVEDLSNDALVIPNGVVFSRETVVLESCVFVPDVARYGIGDNARHRLFAQWTKEATAFRVPGTGIFFAVHDAVDDAGGNEYLLLWLNDNDSKWVRSWFNK